MLNPTACCNTSQPGPEPYILTKLLAPTWLTCHCHPPPSSTHYPPPARPLFQEYDAGGKLAEEDLDQRLKWAGFFHRRKITYGRYMMRTKLPNGICSASQVGRGA